MFECIVDAEKAAVDDAFLKSVLSRLMWTENTWIREMLIANAEGDGTGLPSDALEEVRYSNSAPATTKLNEDGFNIGRKAMRASPCGKLTGQAFHHTLNACPVLEEADFKAIDTNVENEIATAADGRAALPSSYYDA